MMVWNHLGMAALIAMAVGFAAAAQATDLKLSNPSFEANSVADGAMSASHSGWNKHGDTGDAVTWHPTATSFVSADGSGGLPSPAAGTQCLWVAGNVDLYQVYSYFSHIKADKAYTLTAAIGAPLDRDFGDFGLVLASPAGEIVSTGGTAGIVNKSGRFYDKSTSFNTGPNGRRDLVGKMLIVNLNGSQAAIDNVRLAVTPIPEPGEAMTPAAKPGTPVAPEPDDSMPWFTVTLVAILIGGVVGLSVCAWWIWKQIRAFCHR
jgi:hypothetical protein